MGHYFFDRRYLVMYISLPQIFLTLSDTLFNFFIQTTSLFRSFSLALYTYCSHSQFFLIFVLFSLSFCSSWFLSPFHFYSVCPRSSDPFYIVSYIKWVISSWLYSYDNLIFFCIPSSSGPSSRSGSISDLTSEADSEVFKVKTKVYKTN